ncbi:LlaJI family restriction endonuclease [Alkalihalobacillus sp. BA299]|uniref:LlaJI family restriction endonuclease n=1 Tax=Alkalihalobacillus sp. BA299 TaxID=2815938 RepID=UPI001AD99981|nr:LlaJI family restriction endonuclease [Alkalihalobacillus sp. BA299]
MNNINLYDNCFIELDEYPFDKYDGKIPNELFIRGICVKKDEKLVFNCTGFMVIHNQIFVVFPKGYVIPKEHILLKKHIRLLIDVLIKYSRDSSLEPVEGSLLGGLGTNSELIAAAFWLIRDYFDYGIINFQRQDYGINQSANINWSRTIKGVNPVISNKSPVYLDLVTKKNTHHDHLITQIHQYVVEQCLDLYGWLFDYDEGVQNEYDLPYDEDLVIYLLDMEAQRTFEDRKSNLFLNLKEFITGSHNHSKDSVMTFVTPYFHTVWEKFCHFLFSDNEVPELPKPYWEVNNTIARTEQIPDVMFKVDNRLVILDAKYYRIKFAPKKLPGWGDLVKQFFYRLTLMKDEKDLIENIFIFPGQTRNVIEYLGYAAVEEMPSLGKIHGYTLDIHKAMELYVSNNKGDSKEKLLSLLKSPEKGN